MNSISVSIPKVGEQSLNEDAVINKEDIIAVSDGAGGGGLYADRWSAYLLQHLPRNPIESFEQLDGWLDEIWEPFYLSSEKSAQEKGGLLLNKFYEEGSFATLACVWRVGKNKWKWMSYGDSVVFHYRKDIHVLQHSFSELCDFNGPPYLISSKDPLSPEGFSSGSFLTCKGESLVFVASDALAHYVIALYELSRHEQFKEEILKATRSHSKNSNCIKNLQNLHIQKRSFFSTLSKLLVAAESVRTFSKFVSRQQSMNFIANDDYSLAAICL